MKNLVELITSTVFLSIVVSTVLCLHIAVIDILWWAYSGFPLPNTWGKAADASDSVSDAEELAEFDDFLEDGERDVPYLHIQNLNNGSRLETNNFKDPVAIDNKFFCGKLLFIVPDPSAQIATPTSVAASAVNGYLDQRKGEFEIQLQGYFKYPIDIETLYLGVEFAPGALSDISEEEKTRLRGWIEERCGLFHLSEGSSSNIDDEVPHLTFPLTKIVNFQTESHPSISKNYHPTTTAESARETEEDTRNKIERPSTVTGIMSTLVPKLGLYVRESITSFPYARFHENSPSNPPLEYSDDVFDHTTTTEPSVQLTVGAESQLPPVHTFVVTGFGIDLVRWKLKEFGKLGNIDLAKFCGGRSLKLVIYSLEEQLNMLDPAVRHNPLSKLSSTLARGLEKLQQPHCERSKRRILDVMVTHLPGIAPAETTSLTTLDWWKRQVFGFRDEPESKLPEFDELEVMLEASNYSIAGTKSENEELMKSNHSSETKNKIFWPSSFSLDVAFTILPEQVTDVETKLLEVSEASSKAGLNRRKARNLEQEASSGQFIPRKKQYLPDVPQYRGLVKSSLQSPAFALSSLTTSNGQFLFRLYDPLSLCEKTEYSGGDESVRVESLRCGDIVSIYHPSMKCYLVSNKGRYVVFSPSLPTEITKALFQVTLCDCVTGEVAFGESIVFGDRIRFRSHRWPTLEIGVLSRNETVGKNTAKETPESLLMPSMLVLYEWNRYEHNNKFRLEPWVVEGWSVVPFEVSLLRSSLRQHPAVTELRESPDAPRFYPMVKLLGRVTVSHPYSGAEELAYLLYCRSDEFNDENAFTKTSEVFSTRKEPSSYLEWITLRTADELHILLDNLEHYYFEDSAPSLDDGLIDFEWNASPRAQLQLFKARMRRMINEFDLNESVFVEDSLDTMDINFEAVRWLIRQLLDSTLLDSWRLGWSPGFIDRLPIERDVDIQAENKLLPASRIQRTTCGTDVGLLMEIIQRFELQERSLCKFGCAVVRSVGEGFWAYEFALLDENCLHFYRQTSPVESRDSVVIPEYSIFASQITDISTPALEDCVWLGFYPLNVETIGLSHSLFFTSDATRRMFASKLEEAVTSAQNQRQHIVISPTIESKSKQRVSIFNVCGGFSTFNSDLALLRIHDFGLFNPQIDPFSTTKLEKQRFPRLILNHHSHGSNDKGWCYGEYNIDNLNCIDCSGMVQSTTTNACESVESDRLIEMDQINGVGSEVLKPTQRKLKKENSIGLQESFSDFSRRFLRLAIDLCVPVARSLDTIDASFQVHVVGWYFAVDCSKVDQENWKEFLEESGKLKRINLREIDFSNMETTCFFVNIYHALLLHAQLLFGLPDFELWNEFSQRICYQIGEEVFSLYDIEHFVVRGLLYRKLYSSPKLSSPTGTTANEFITPTLANWKPFALLSSLPEPPLLSNRRFVYALQPNLDELAERETTADSNSNGDKSFNDIRYHALYTLLLFPAQAFSPLLPIMSLANLDRMLEAAIFFMVTKDMSVDLQTRTLTISRACEVYLLIFSLLASEQCVTSSRTTVSSTSTIVGVLTGRMFSSTANEDLSDVPVLKAAKPMSMAEKARVAYLCAQKYKENSMVAALKQLLSTVPDASIIVKVKKFNPDWRREFLILE